MTRAGEAPALCAVGSLAFDDVETPFGRRDGMLGGSAVYFAVAASYFARTGVVGVVGSDFPTAFEDVLRRHGADLAGLERRATGRTFHWSGRYEGTMDRAETLVTDLNVLAEFAPRLPPAYRRAPYVFLANTAPAAQASVLDQLEDPRLVVADTMNFWIEHHREALLQVLGRVDGLVVNDVEARMLAGKDNLIAAGRGLLRLGPRFAVVKKGEHGSFLFSEERSFALPSYPLEHVVDPTGAGDTFAGGLLGRLAGTGGGRVGDVCEAMLYATVLASFTVSDFGLDALVDLDKALIDARAEELRRFVHV